MKRKYQTLATNRRILTNVLQKFGRRSFIFIIAAVFK